MVYKKSSAFHVLPPVGKLMLDDNEVVDDELFVELERNRSDGFLTMRVPVIAHPIGKQDGMMPMAGATPLALINKVAGEINRPTQRASLQPPQMGLTVSTQANMLARYAIGTQSFHHIFCAGSLTGAFHNLLNLGERIGKHTLQGNRAAVGRTLLKRVKKLFAKG